MRWSPAAMRGSVAPATASRASAAAKRSFVACNCFLETRRVYRSSTLSHNEETEEEGNGDGVLHVESSSWCRYSKRRKRRRRLLKKRSGSMEAGSGSRARHWNGMKNGVTGGWTSRDSNVQLISSSDSSSSEEDGASPAEHPDDQRTLSPGLAYFYRLGVEELNYTICTNF